MHTDMPVAHTHSMQEKSLLSHDKPGRSSGASIRQGLLFAWGVGLHLKAFDLKRVVEMPRQTTCPSSIAQ